MPIDLDAVELEALYWKPTGELRWRRPKRGTDNDLILEQLYERTSGERSWREVPRFFED